MKLALEPLNRFEAHLLNTCDQAIAFASRVGDANFGILYDTFHAHIEEKDPIAALRALHAAGALRHVHISENDRGTPGTGQVPWTEVRDALKDIGYDRTVAIEGFNPEIVDLANGACIWRPMAPTQDRLAGEGAQFLKKLFG